MNTSKKEEFLLKQGRKQETIDFCKELKISTQKFVWFCERIEKENFNIKDENFKEYIKKTLKLLERTNVYNNVSSLEKLIRIADKYVETDEHELDRILYKFKDGNYIINLSSKELFLEGKEMSNCLGDIKCDGKRIAILALKDKKHKTLVHLQINNLGFLEQHYSKANTAVNSKKWKYINEFFDIHKDEQFFEKINSTKINVNYNISNQTYNYIPIVEYFIPTKTTNSLFTLDKLRVNEKYHIKDFVNTTQFNIPLNKKDGLNKEELFSYLIDFKNYINKSIEDIVYLVNISHKNYYNLNNIIVQKIFNSRPPKVEEKILSISNNNISKPKMVVDYAYRNAYDELGDIYDELEDNTIPNPFVNYDFNYERIEPRIEPIASRAVSEDDLECEGDLEHVMKTDFEFFLENNNIETDIKMDKDAVMGLEPLRFKSSMMSSESREHIDFISILKNDFSKKEGEEGGEVFKPVNKEVINKAVRILEGEDEGEEDEEGEIKFMYVDLSKKNNV
jgi:hypothetical protein